MIYLDYNSTAPIRSEALSAMAALPKVAGNPASLHSRGRGARRILDDAADAIRALAGSDAAEVVLTSGGTEADNLALIGMARSRANKCGARAVVISTIEHPAVLAAAGTLDAEGFEIRKVPVGSDGVLDLDAFRAAVADDVALVSIMLANNETGVLQPIREVCEIASGHGVPVHTDAVQAVGKVPQAAWKVPGTFLLADADSVDRRPLDRHETAGLGKVPGAFLSQAVGKAVGKVPGTFLPTAAFDALGVAAMSLSSHKFGGPRGIGALILKPGTDLEPLWRGGSQEQGRRPGTQAPLPVVGMAAAARVAAAEVAGYQTVAALRDDLVAQLCELPGSFTVGEHSPKLPNTASIGFRDLPSRRLVDKLSEVGIMVSGGAACHAGSVQPSKVLLAMGLNPDRASEVLRFSIGRSTTAEEISEAAEEIRAVLFEMRGAE